MKAVLLCIIIAGWCTACLAQALPKIDTAIGPTDMYMRRTWFTTHIDSMSVSDPLASYIGNGQLLIACDLGQEIKVYRYDTTGRLLDQSAWPEKKPVRKIDYSIKYNAVMTLAGDEKSIGLTDILTHQKKKISGYTPEKWWSAKDSIYGILLDEHRGSVMTWHYKNIDYPSLFDYGLQLSLLPDSDIVQFMPDAVIYLRSPGYFTDTRRSFIYQGNFDRTTVLDSEDSLLMLTDNCFTITAATRSSQKSYSIAGPVSEFCSHTRYYPLSRGAFIDVHIQDNRLEVGIWKRK